MDQKRAQKEHKKHMNEVSRFNKATQPVLEVAVNLF